MQVNFGLIIVGDEILSGKRQDKHLPRVIELLGARGLALSWARYVGDESNVVGMRGFGASAPAGKLYDHFGITADKVVELARRRLSG